MGPVTYSKDWPSDSGPERPLLRRLFTHYKSSIKGDSLSSDDSSSDSINHPHVVMLSENYRCHKDILSFPSDCFYGGHLVAKGNVSAIPNMPCLSFYTAQGKDEIPDGGRLQGYYNDAEVEEITQRVRELVDICPRMRLEDIGVLTPYTEQVKR